MRWSLALLLAGCVKPAPRVVPGWAPRAAAASPRPEAPGPSGVEVDAEAVWWRPPGDGAAREVLVPLDAQGLPGDAARFTERVRGAIRGRLTCGARVPLAVRVTSAARVEALFRLLASLPACVEPSLGLAGDPRPALRLVRAAETPRITLRRVTRGWQVDLEGQAVAPGCREAGPDAVTVGPTEGDRGETLRACVRALVTAPTLRPWFAVQNGFAVAAWGDATMGEVFSAAGAFAVGMESVSRAALVTLALTTRAVEGQASRDGPTRPFFPPTHVPAHDRQLGALRDALSTCAADGGPLEVAGSFAASSGRFVAARPIAGSPSARACAERALGAVTLAPPQFARIDLVWRLPLLVEPAAADDALARRAYAGFAARSRQMRACYEAALRSDVQLGGRVEVETLVAGSGVVLAVTTRSPPSLGEAAACIAGVLAASDGSEATGGSFALTFPVVLAAAQ